MGKGWLDPPTPKGDDPMMVTTNHTGCPNMWSILRYHLGTRRAKEMHNTAFFMPHILFASHKALWRAVLPLIGSYSIFRPF